MARRPITPAQRAELAAMETRVSMDGVDFDQFATGAKRKASTNGKRTFKKIARSRMERELEETRRLVKAEEYAAFTPKHLVWLYAHLHENVYGALPLELLEHYSVACMAAGRMVREFGGMPKALDFMRWTWRRETKSFPTRTSDFRIGWRYQFGSASLMTDFRIFLSKQKPGAKG